MRNALKPIVGFKSPRQLCMALDSLELRGLRSAERIAVISRLTRLLTEAAGVTIAERGDD